MSRLTSIRRRPRRFRAAARGARLCRFLWVATAVGLSAAAPSALAAPQSDVRAAPFLAQVDLPPGDANQTIVIQAERGAHWTQGSYEVWLLRGDCRLRQGQDSAAGREAVLWIDRPGPAERRASTVIAYFEGEIDVKLYRSGGEVRVADRTWLGRFRTARPVDVQVAETIEAPATPPEICRRGLAEFTRPAGGAVRQAQFVEAQPGAPADALPPGTRRIRAFARSGVPAVADWRSDPDRNQWIAVIESGVTILIDGLELPQKTRPGQALPSPRLGVLDISADRVVIWTSGLEQLDLKGGQLQDEKIPLEIYMEGNIVFRQGERTIYADRMYYDVSNRTGTVLNAEVLTPVPRYEGLLRLRAQVLQQLGPERFVAQNAFVTSSRLGMPRYRLESGSITLDDFQEPRVDPASGAPILDEKMQPIIDHDLMLSAENNVLYVEEVPIFYWPFLATDLSEPSLYLRRARFRHDRIFGTQALTDWNVYQLLGIRKRPPGTDWGLSLDYMSERGFGHGSTFTYRIPGSPGVPGPAGLIDYWGIPDHGNDNLGLDRRVVPPEQSYRYRLFGQHRQMLDCGWQVAAEVGWMSDRNFLEQYFEREWDELKDQDTSLELKRVRDNTSLSFLAAVRINDFFTQTDWLPRADHFWLGQSLGDDVFTWYEHSGAAYAQLHTATLPDLAQDPARKTRFLPWEVSPAGAPLSTKSERFFTRQEIDWPFQLGPVKVVPYLLGEAAHWGEDLDGHDIERLYGQAGIRASIPAWTYNPNVESVFWNVHGLAHKVVFDAEFSFTDASKDLDRLPLYDPLDDDSIEAFRRRFVPNTFPGAAVIPWPAAAIPRRFDERFYAVRSGMADWVTAPSMEVVDDLTVFRLGMHNRWQTKRGTPGHQRIVDWITLDVNMSLFPNADRDNFGKVLGLLDYDARWQVGDRLALLSSGIFDFFDQGQHIVNIGTFLDRPPKGGLYVGVRLLDGPIRNTVLATSYTYRMSPKWVSAFGMSVDLGNQGNIGENFSVTRIGESFLVSAGVNVDASRGSWGFGMSIEPRFLPKTRLGQAGGARVPVAGAFGLE